MAHEGKMRMRNRLIKLVLECSTYTPQYEEKATLHAMYLADKLLREGVIVPPCKLGDEIDGEIVHGIDYKECLSCNGTHKEAFVHTMDKSCLNSVIFCSHPITWEEAEKALAKMKGEEQ